MSLCSNARVLLAGDIRAVQRFGVFHIQLSVTTSSTEHGSQRAQNATPEVDDRRVFIENNLEVGLGVVGVPINDGCTHDAFGATTSAGSFVSHSVAHVLAPPNGRDHTRRA